MKKGKVEVVDLRGRMHKGGRTTAGIPTQRRLVKIADILWTEIEKRSYKEGMTYVMYLNTQLAKAMHIKLEG